MSKLELWILRKILRANVIQGHDHNKNITELFNEINLAVINEFREDNIPTIFQYLKDRFEDSLKRTEEVFTYKPVDK